MLTSALCCVETCTIYTVFVCDKCGAPVCLIHGASRVGGCEWYCPACLAERETSVDKQYTLDDLYTERYNYSTTRT